MSSTHANHGTTAGTIPIRCTFRGRSFILTRGDGWWTRQVFPTVPAPITSAAMSLSGVIRSNIQEAPEAGKAAGGDE